MELREWRGVVTVDIMVFLSSDMPKLPHLDHEGLDNETAMELFWECTSHRQGGVAKIRGPTVRTVKMGEVPLESQHR